jgi:hypothetical protein
MRSFEMKPNSMGSIYLLIAGLCTTLLMPTVALAASDAPLCAGADANASKVLWKRISKYPVYLMLRQRLGTPLSCSVTTAESRQTVVVQFAQDGSFILNSDSVLESASQQAVLPKSAKLTWAKARTVLRNTERQAAAPDGCGVDWSKLARQPTAPAIDAEAEGSDCNCKARLASEGDYVVRLKFSLAC